MARFPGIGRTLGELVAARERMNHDKAGRRSRVVQNGRYAPPVSARNQVENRARTLALIAGPAAASAAGLHFFGLSPWTEPSRSISIEEFLAVVVVLSVCTGLERRCSDGERGAIRLSFVGEVIALLLLGPAAMTLAAAIAALTRVFTDSRRWTRQVVSIGTAIVAAVAAGSLYAALGGTPPPLRWPWQTVPIAVAVLVYVGVTSLANDLVALTTRAVNPRVWLRSVLGTCPSYFIGATISVAVGETIAHRAWYLVPAAALPLYCAWHAFASRAERGGRRRHMFESSDKALSVVDDRGRIIRWNAAVERLLECPREGAIGRTLAAAVPALSASDLPRTLDDALRCRGTRTQSRIVFSSSTGGRALNVTIVPAEEGLMLLWRDVTEQTIADQALRQAADRCALIAEGANDGLWELNRRTGTLYVSQRWRSIVGLPPGESGAALDEWFDRVHADDIKALKEALEAHMTGATDHFELEHRIRHDEGTYRRVFCRGVAAKDGSGQISRIGGSLSAVSETGAVKTSAVIAELRDPLTGLCNRAAFVAKVGQQLVDYKLRREEQFAALYLDLDRFKLVNDSLGHLVGDELLAAVSRRLESCLRPGDAIARLGGDEFAILLPRLSDPMQANVVAFRIQDALSAPFSISGREVVTSASIGIAFSRVEYASPEEIMRDADTAMYHAKTHGKARHELFDADMHTRSLDRLALEGDLRQAVKNRDFELYFQPIVSLKTWMCTGFETLVRWQRNGKPVSPADFVPMAEELGLIEPLGTWVLQQACRTFAEWRQRFADGSLEYITVNVSTRQLVQQGFMYLVEQTIKQTGIRPRDLRLEITETAIMDAPQLAAQVLRELREFGVKIYLDDFGTGYSSLSHLHKLPVDVLKIDRSFVTSLLADDRPAMVESILALARALQTGVVAEGVEYERQARALERLGCTQAQGFLFSKPVPSHLAEEILAARRPLGSSGAAERQTPPSANEDSTEERIDALVSGTYL